MCQVSFVIHPSFYLDDEAVLGGNNRGAYAIAAKEFCVCRSCKLSALKGCLGETEGGIQRHVYPSGYSLSTFICDSCAAGLLNEHKPKCACCEESKGLLRKTNNNHWVHYTCALLSNKCRILSLADMRFELNEELENGKHDQKKTRSKKQAETQSLHGLLMKQTMQIVSGEKESEDPSLTLFKFVFSQKEDHKQSLIESKELAEAAGSSVEFSAGQKNKKSGKKKAKPEDIL